MKQAYDDQVESVTPMSDRPSQKFNPVELVMPNQNLKELAKEAVKRWREEREKPPVRVLRVHDVLATVSAKLDSYVQPKAESWVTKLRKRILGR